MQTEKRIIPKAVAAGVLVYLTGLVLIFLAGVLMSSTAAYRAAQAGAGQQQIAEQVARRLAGPGFALTAFGLSSVFALLGGFLASRLAPSEWLRHALPVGLLSLFAGILLVLLMPFTVPVWALPLVLLSPVPLALAGGYLGGRTGRPAPEPEGEEAETEPELSDEEETARWVARRARAEEQNVRLVGHLVQQRREQESQRQRQRADEERRAALERAIEQSKSEACDDMREVVREAFMSHPAATEDDFERCWPELRDEVFRQHALKVYRARAPHAGEDLGAGGPHGGPERATDSTLKV